MNYPYQNPHQTVHRSPYGGHQPHYQQVQPQPQVPINSIQRGADGRDYIMTQNGWQLYVDPRMQQGGPQPMPQYPTVGQPTVYQAPQQYPQQPVYQAPPQHLPVYQPQAQQPVYNNRQPSSSGQSGRFGGSGAAHPQQVQQTTASSYTPANQKTNEGEKEMQYISAKTALRHPELKNTGFALRTRTNPFSATAAVVASPSNFIITDCLDELVETAIEKTVTHTQSPSVWIANGVIEMIYHKADQKKYAADLLQRDVKSIYKAFKTHIKNVDNRYDLAYLTAINGVITEIVNDALYPILNSYPVIESFVEDFNDLLRIIRNTQSAETEDLFIESVNATLTKIESNLEMLERLKVEEVEPEPAPLSTEEPQATELDEILQPEELVVDQHVSVDRAIIPVPVQIICLNFLNAELGDEKNLAKMLGGLLDVVTDPVGYVCTIDKAVYKAYFGGEKVLVELLRG